MMKSQRVQEFPAEPPLDVDELLARCMGRLDLVERVLNRFRQTLDKEIELLAEAVRAKDVESVARLAHRIKGTSLTVAAHGLEACAQRLEASATTHRLEGIEECLAAMRNESSRLDEVMANRLSATD